MKHLLRRRDTEALIDGIVDGHPVNNAAGLDDVEAFLSEMQTEFGATPAPAPRPTLASTLDGRRPLRPASSGPAPKPTIPEPRPRPHLFRPAAVVFATGAVLFGGLASAGALPGPVQRGTAELTSHVGHPPPGCREAPAGAGGPRRAGDRVPRTGDDPSGTKPATVPVDPPTTVPSAADDCRPPSPSSRRLPTPPTTLTLPLPDVGSLLEPVAAPAGPDGTRATCSGVLPTDLIP